MKTSKILLILAPFLLLSCSTKTQNRSKQNDFNKGLKKMKPSEKTEVASYDVLTYVNDENFDQLLKKNNVAFVVFGMVSNDYSDFEKKYGIKVKTENCVITPGMSKIAKTNNLIIFNYMTEKYKEDWKSDLPIIPFGLN